MKGNLLVRFRHIPVLFIRLEPGSGAPHPGRPLRGRMAAFMRHRFHSQNGSERAGLPAIRVT